jgi:hypothetical protein
VGLDRLTCADRLIIQCVTFRYVRYFDDFPFTPLTNVWADTAARGWFEDKLYVVQTTSLARLRSLKHGFAGSRSASTANENILLTSACTLFA